MTGPELFFLAVVVAIGIPAATRNLTAAALVGSYVFVQAVYHWTGVQFDPQTFVMIDMAVLWVIYVLKPPAYDCFPYGSFGYQLCAVWLERSWWDRFIVACFPLAWFVYAMPTADWWWSLYWISLAQFFAAGGEAFISWQTSAANASDAEVTPDNPSSGAGLRIAWGRAGDG